ncbi:peptidoglycan recognition protein family protein [Tepidicaulis sp. LMO-SS28]|uniref:peptidoglycan recognition protein family protein n=1 Tax=Tepidicaulis sp. LMO-SS28 TaxID=3447455 RepID=UPI003EDF3037
MSAKALQIEDCASPNCEERRLPADLLLLHYTGMESGAAALERLCDPAAKVSAHYLVEEDGRIFRLVPEEKRAWHAGVANWRGESDINSCSIGIEIVNPGHDFGYPDFPPAQIAAVEALCLDILARHDIPPQRVLGHSDVAPERKADPGEKFPWPLMAAAGIGHWTQPQEIVEGPVLAPGNRGDTVAELQYQLADYGYGIEVLGIYDAKTEAVVRAFQRHFRPARVDGVADVSTVATLRMLRESLRG